MLERVTELWPDSLIDIAVGANLADLLLGMNGLNRVFLFSPRKSKVFFVNTYSRLLSGILFYRRQMMKFDYDLAIVPRWGSIETYEAVYLAYLTGATERGGYSASVDHGDTAIDALFTRVAHGGAHEQEAIRNVRLLSRLGLAPENANNSALVEQPILPLVKLGSKGEEQINRLLAQAAPGVNGKYAVISPGATAPFRAWPIEYLAEALKMLHREFSLAFVIVGSRDDAALCRDLAQNLPGCAFSLAGMTSLMQLAALISKADLYLGNDTGTAHIAGGLGVPTVVVSPFPLSCEEEHFNSPVRFRPCGPLVQVVQPARPLAPCYPTCAFHNAHCIRQVDPEEVFVAASGLLIAREVARGARSCTTPLQKDLSRAQRRGTDVEGT